MATLSAGYSFSSNETVTNTKLHNLVDNATISNIVTADISDSQITSAKIADGTIVNADINASAAIVGSKLDLSAPGVIGGTTPAAITGTTITGNSFVVNANGGYQMTEGTAPSTAASTGALYTKDTGGQPELFYREESDGDEVQITSGGVLNSGAIVQMVNTSIVTAPTGTTQLPADDTIPQNSEGDEYFTQAITPSNASNKLRIDVVVICATSNVGHMGVALFQDSTANALACTSVYPGAANQMVTIPLTYWMTAGTTSSTTFKVRVGCENAGTTTINGYGGNRKYGGVAVSGITITEIVP